MFNSTSNIALGVALVVALVCLTHAYPSGAPTEACDSLSPERGHGVASMPVQYAPFTVIAYGNSYRPGDKIPSEYI